MARIVITGVGGGLGSVIARKFLEKGDQVFGCDANADGLKALEESLGALSDGLSTVVCDLTSGSETAALCDQVLAWGASVDVLVNNVGLAGPRAGVDEIADEDWDALMSGNLMAPIRLIRALAPAMKAQKSGAIVNISTSSVFTRPLHRSPYVVSKAALESLTLTLARELGPFDIRCNVVRPGLMNNDRGRMVLERVAKQSGRTFEETLAEELQYTSMAAMVEMDEVAGAVLYLASHEARHVTGQIIAVDGGQMYEG